jgi:hypothetical protein
MFFINGNFEAGYFNYFSKDKNSGGLRYSKITDWHAGEDPGPDYTDQYLLDPVVGFYIQPGIDLGMNFGFTRLILNVHAKVFPLAFGSFQEAIINDGTNQRDIRLSVPTWIIPFLTLGMTYFF